LNFLGRNFRLLNFVGDKFKPASAFLHNLICFASIVGSYYTFSLP